MIRDTEIPQMALMQRTGLQVKAIFSSASLQMDPTLTDWRPLLGRGFPFIKVQLLRDNPFKVDISGWDFEMISRGYDVSIVLDHLEARFIGSAAADAMLTD